MTALGIEKVLPIEARHVFGLFDLPNIHRDLFDRLLVSHSGADPTGKPVSGIAVFEKQ